MDVLAWMLWTIKMKTRSMVVFLNPLLNSLPSWKNIMYNKHHEVEEEAYKELQKLVGQNMSPTLINSLAALRNDLNERYKGEYYVEFVPLTEVVDRFIVNVKVHTVH
ncbi:hypothetical protein [Escherichia phage AnYang]|uniref:Uncharacterized protein n=2 Tax=root TaxID=1 RepID=A0A410T5I9_9CAUD|nr:hypothetical protein KNU29_gp151 [Escherichia phage AnYang]QAU03771.1 hypothetical protein [Escherichia phage AnYang]